MDSEAGEITLLLRRWQDGNKSAEEQLFQLLLPELRKIAGCVFRRERPNPYGDSQRGFPKVGHYQRGAEPATQNPAHAQLWPPDVIVSFEVGINQAVRKLRLALNDLAAKPPYIETVGRRGYRLLVPRGVGGSRSRHNGCNGR